MNHKLLILFGGMVLGGIGSWAVFHASAEIPEKKDSAPASSTETKEDMPGITLTTEQMAQVGVKTEQPHPVKLFDERKGFGQVLDPSPLLNGFAEITLAEATSAASEKEYLRVKDLHENGDNASGQAVDVAALTAERDRIQLSTSLTKMKTAWGAWAASEAARHRLADQLSAGGSFLRIDFEGSEASGAQGKIVVLYRLDVADSVLSRAEILAAATSIDAQFQGQSFWAIVSDQTLPVGTNVEARLRLGQSEKDALALPASALLRHEGKVFIYVQISPEKFVRKNVRVLQWISGEEAISGVESSDRVVTTGAQQLLSAEFGAEGSGD